MLPVHFQKKIGTGSFGQLFPNNHRNNNAGSTKNCNNDSLVQRRLIKRIFQRRIQNPVEHLRWSLLRK